MVNMSVSRGDGGGSLLVSSDLTERDGTWPVPVWFLDTTGGWGSLSGSLRGDWTEVSP